MLCQCADVALCQVKTLSSRRRVCASPETLWSGWTKATNGSETKKAFQHYDDEAPAFNFRSRLFRDVLAWFLIILASKCVLVRPQIVVRDRMEVTLERHYQLRFQRKAFWVVVSR